MIIGLRFDDFLHWDWNVALFPMFILALASVLASFKAFIIFVQLLLHLDKQEKIEIKQQSEKEESAISRPAEGEEKEGKKKFKPLKSKTINLIISLGRFGFWYMYLTLGLSGCLTGSSISLARYLQSHNKKELSKFGIFIGLFPTLYLLFLVLFTMCQFRHLEYFLSEFFSEKSNLNKGKLELDKSDQSVNTSVRRMHLQTLSEIDRKENNETSAPLNIAEEP